MEPKSFAHSDSFSLGIELELQLIDLKNFNLTPASPSLLCQLKKNAFPGTVTPEITESMIEAATGIHTTYPSALAQLKKMGQTLIDSCNALDIGISGGGTHPFQDWGERKIFRKSRFREISRRYGYLAKQFTIFGQHIHVGCSSGDDALYLLHALNRYVPHFIALSAYSPYVQGKDTQFQSARLNSVFAFPLSGRAPFILSWDEFVNGYLSKMEKTGIVKSMKDFYWDIRPKPEFGTIELRVCDTPLSLDCAAALAAYLQALCVHLTQHRDQIINDDDYLVYNFNRFQACRFGLDAMIVQPSTYEQLTLRDSILTTLEMLEPYAANLGSLEGLAYLRRKTARGSDADVLRKQFKKRENQEDMVNFAMESFKKSALSGHCV